MNKPIYNPLQIREVFHLEFLRWFARKLGAEHYVLKGGVNLRLFFKSVRYSEDMDIDIKGTPRIDRIQKNVTDILTTRGFKDSLKSFGIEEVIAPDLSKAKQTETTQRFKIHLLTASGEDLFTKVEFSRRGLKGSQVVESVSSEILRAYKMAPLIIPHYDAASAVMRKIHALAGRTAVQARDIFDLFVLNSQYPPSSAADLSAKRKGTDPTRFVAGELSKHNKTEISRSVLKTAYDNLFMVGFPQFRDTVLAYLGEEDQKTYSSPAVWDEIKLNTVQFLEELGK